MSATEDEEMPRAGMAYQTGPYAYKKPASQSTDPDKWNVKNMPREVRENYQAPDELGGY